MNKPASYKLLVGSLLSAMLILPVTGCSSTTSGGAIGGERKQLLLVSSQDVLQMSNASYQKTISAAKAAGKLDTNAVQLARLKRIANRLIAHTSVYRTDATSWNWEVHTIRTDDINAFVMPGGKIIFYTGIIEQLNLTDAEIAAIMGHEMAHALREHSREQLSRQIATQSGLGIAASALGLSSGQVQAASLVGELGMSLPHSRTQETEADRMGLELMARAGYDPNAAVSLWKKMQAADGQEGPQFLSTHPNNSTRINTLQSLIPAVMPLYQQAAQ